LAVLFILNRVRSETDTWEFYCTLRKDDRFAVLDLQWLGAAITAETVKQWESQYLILGDEKSPLSLKEVLSHHEAALWPYTLMDAENRSGVRFLLPAGPVGDTETLRPITVAPASQADFFNFGSFERPGQNPELDNRLLAELSYTALIRGINEATHFDQVIARQGELPALMHGMIASGAKVRNLTKLITALSDAVVRRLMGFVIAEIGPPPARFAFVALGSEGRKEQTLKTDQDNAVIFEDISQGAAVSGEKVHSYFLRLGEKICAGLDQAGYSFCAGDIMARNPRWCQPLSAWKEYFSRWIHAAEPENLLHSSIFFDFRPVFGDAGITEALSMHLIDSLAGWSGFFRHLTENAVFFKPPIGFFGQFTVKSRGEHRNCLDIKHAITPIVDFARIYALKHAIRETNTQERLYQLYVKKVLSRQEYQEIEQAYDFMMQVRFVQQIKAVINEQKPPDNFVNPKKLSAMERKMLKEAFRLVERIQTKMSYEFIGAHDSHLK
jgi:CBS domain-containing protein